MRLDATERGDAPYGWIHATQQFWLSRGSQSELAIDHSRRGICAKLLRELALQTTNSSADAATCLAISALQGEQHAEQKS